MRLSIFDNASTISSAVTPHRKFWGLDTHTEPKSSDLPCSASCVKTWRPEPAVWL